MQEGHTGEKESGSLAELQPINQLCALHNERDAKKILCTTNKRFILLKYFQ